MFRSVRPAVLLALAVAVACTDQPTEPTAAEGSIRAALPPPAEASVLTGTLPGGDGTGVSAELGFYESPVYATVTVSGALTYSGRPDGYLPGTGQIDAAGIMLQNQCDLTVYISSATSAGGGTLPIAPTCWYPARNLGNYSRRMVLAGRIWTYRTYGPPLSCWKYPAPCVSYQGTQTVTVTPEEGNLVVTPSTTVVGPGGVIGFTAKGVWATDGKTVVPMAVREWRWKGSGREVGGGHTTVCEPATNNPCNVRLYQSGTVTLEAVVNGKVKTEKVWVRVIGGDSLPPDSLPHLRVECNGAAESIQVVRGEVTTCVASFSNGATLAGVRWSADPEDGPDILPVTGKAGAFPGDVTSTWSGPTILSTKVKVWATPAGSTAEQGPAEVAIQVTPRSWSAWSVGTPDPGFPNSVAEFHQLDGAGKLPRPHISGSRQILGFFYPTRPEFAGEPVLEAASGPNRGWSTLAREYSNPQSVVYLHPDLFAGDWYDEQNGGLSRSGRYCERSDVARFVSMARGHEYLSNDSHLAHWNAALASLDLQGRIERLKGYSMSTTDLQLRATASAKRVYTDIAHQEDAWDAREYWNITASLGCEFDFVIGDGR